MGAGGTVVGTGEKVTSKSDHSASRQMQSQKKPSIAKGRLTQLDIMGGKTNLHLHNLSLSFELVQIPSELGRLMLTSSFATRWCNNSLGTDQMRSSPPDKTPKAQSL